MKQNNPPITRIPRRETFRRGTTAAFLGCLTLSASLIVGGCTKNTEKDAKVDGVDRAALNPATLQDRLSNIDKLSLPQEKKDELKRAAQENDAALKAQAAEHAGQAPAPAPAAGGNGTKPPPGYVVPPGAMSK